MTRSERLAYARHRHALWFDVPIAAILGMLLVLSCVWLLDMRRSSAAVSQVERVYACVGTNGSVTLRAYAMPCRGGQVVSWAVRGEP